MKILIADDHALFRDSLRSLLEARGLEVIGEARNGREAVELTARLKPEVVLMDLSMPEMDGIAATRLISADQPEIKVVILTASDEDAKLFEAIKSGAQGYLLKKLESEDFFNLLDGV
ncbi:MAG TPA: response regulator transcription factor, partial [Thermoanaerobaculia bacterium]|nr:response regulator transcription factor [Thermoanaerobaculia bacterium]